MMIFSRWPLAAVALAALLAGCGSETNAAPSEPDSGAVPTTNAAVTAKLAAADAVDGETDKVVHRCAGCALGMDGKKEHSLEVGDYEMHFCKTACYERFAGDTDTQILALKIPAK